MWYLHCVLCDVMSMSRVLHCHGTYYMTSCYLVMLWLIFCVMMNSYETKPRASANYHERKKGEKGENEE